MTFPSLDGLPRFSVGNRVLHWIAALLVLVVLPIGFLFDSIKDSDSDVFFFIHESLGFLLLWVMLLRLVFRLASKTPPATWLTPFERILSHCVEGLLYLALIAQPVVGYLLSNAQGFPLVWFGIVPIPSPVGADPELAETLEGLHGLLGWAILVLLLLHILGAIYHHVVRRDPTLYRML